MNPMTIQKNKTIKKKLNMTEMMLCLNTVLEITKIEIKYSQTTLF